GTLTGPSTILSDQGWPLVVNDPDANGNAALRETLQVQVRDSRTNAVETVSLTETGPDTGRFEGTLQTAYGEAEIPGNGRLEVKGDDVLTATYTDAISATGQADIPRTLTATVLKGHNGTINPLPAQITAGDPLKITISDPDLNHTAGAGNDTLSITVT